MAQAKKQFSDVISCKGAFYKALKYILGDLKCFKNKHLMLLLKYTDILIRHKQRFLAFFFQFKYFYIKLKRVGPESCQLSQDYANVIRRTRILYCCILPECNQPSTYLYNYIQANFPEMEHQHQATVPTSQRLLYNSW